MLALPETNPRRINELSERPERTNIDPGEWSIE